MFNSYNNLLYVMARLWTKLERMTPLTLRRKPFISFILFFILVLVIFKGILILVTPPKLYSVAMATLKESDYLKEEKDDRAECSRRIRNVDSYIVYLSNVIVDPQKIMKLRRLKSHVRLVKGFFTVPCIGESSLRQSIFYGANSHFGNWASSLKVITYAKNEKSDLDLVEGYTLAVRRGQTDDAYLRILDMYNTYVAVRMMDQKPKDVLILFVDTYPEEPSDQMWDILFGEVSQLSQIHNRQRFENFIWSIPANLGPIAALDLPLPYLDDFRHHVVTSGGAVSSDEINCQSLRVTLFTYSEDVSVQAEDFGVSNMADIIQTLHKQFPKYEILTVSSDTPDMRQQIQTLAKTDILIGAHGSDLSNTVFLHRGSGLIELFPTLYRIARDTRFQRLAEWSNVFYLSWYNMDFMFRDSQSMFVDPNIVISLVNGMKQIICSHTS